MRYAVILAGGGGTRLWPASRRARPKPLLDLGSDETLLAATARRLEAVCERSRIAVVCGADQAELIAAELDWLEPDNLIVEPEGRDTAAAIGLAAVVLGARDPDAVMGVVPADHHIGDESALAAAAEAAFEAAESSPVIATIGIAPTRAETGYGYLELAGGGGSVREVIRIIEKPDPARARRFVDSGDHLWNAGMFFARADHLRAEIARHLPETGTALAEIEAALGDADRRAAAYARMPRVSIDVGVMEKLAPRAVVCVPAELGWSDIGSWAAVAELRGRDPDGNVHLGEVVSLGGRNNTCVAADGTLIGVVGASDLVIVATGDAVLVTTADRAQEVRALVAAIAAAGREDLL